jgi:RNA polymerase sigma-70 factor (ECF subfamily)
MRSAATSGFVALRTENPALAFEDFDRLVEQYRPRVLRFLYATLRDMDLAESLAQDCFWNAYKSRSSFRGDCSVHTWLMKIAVNLVRNHVQSRRFQFWKRIQNTDTVEMREWPDRGISPEESASIRQQVQSVWNATSSLSNRQRTVFLLRFLEDLDISEIAQTTGLTENSVKVHLFRAVRGIRKRLGASQ